MTRVWKRRNRSHWSQFTFRAVPVLCTWLFALWPIWFGGPSRSVALGLAAAALGAQGVASLPRPNPRAALEDVLQVVWREMWAKAANRLEGDGDMHHRVTIFEARRIWLPKFLRSEKTHNVTHKLVPRLRWPTNASPPLRTWLASERDDQYCEGIAGAAFAKGVEAVSDLPDLRGSNHPDDEQEYATRGFDTEENVKRFRYPARSIGAWMILRRGERWGVLVLDSVDPQGVTIEKLKDRKGGFQRALKLVTKVLESYK